MQQQQQLRATLDYLRNHNEYRSLHQIPGVRVDLKYASTDNFMDRDVYGPFSEAFLHRVAAEMLATAAKSLQAKYPAFSLLVYDALRPRSVQRVLWAHVNGTPEEAYVANPDRGSVHNYGLAVDLTCCDAQRVPLDMGTGFDAFTPLSEPQKEEMYLKSGALSETQVNNRLILRQVMTGAGFLQLAHEWWHFDALPRERIREDFAIIE